MFRADLFARCLYLRVSAKESAKIVSAKYYTEGGQYLKQLPQRGQPLVGRPRTSRGLTHLRSSLIFWYRQKDLCLVRDKVFKEIGVELLSRCAGQSEADYV
jgi:hypothetical protein